MPVLGPTDVPSLQYASHGTSTPTVRSLDHAMRWSLALAVLSGLCVASCWVVMLGRRGDFRTVAAVHALTYAATLTTAVFAGLRLGRAAGDFPHLRSPARVTLDAIAGVGLTGIGVAPLLFDATLFHDSSGPLLLGLAFALLCGTGYRHRLLYDALARCFRAANCHSTARSLAGLGRVKFVYETIWLGCCTTTLTSSALRPNLGGRSDLFQLATVGGVIAALLGCLGFVIVWAVMIVVHASAWQETRE